MEQRSTMLLRVRKNRPVKRSKNKKKLIKRVFHYLTCNCYMFAPLLSTRSRSAQRTSSTRSVEVNKQSSEKKGLLKNLGEYLSSDCYMYAPLLAPTTRSSMIPSLGGSSPLYVEKVTNTVEVSKRKVILKGYKPNEEIVKPRTPVKHGETLKQLIHNSR